jgi:hypothetical protein
MSIDRPIVDRPNRSTAFKQRLYKKYRLSGLTQKESARLAGYSENTNPSHTKAEKDTKRTMAEQFDAVGLTDTRIAEEITNHALGAVKIQSADVYVQNENGRWVVNENSNDFIEVDDNQTRLRALELASKMKKHLVESKNGNGNGGDQIVSIVVKLDSQEATAEDVERIANGITVQTNA